MIKRLLAFSIIFTGSINAQELKIGLSLPLSGPLSTYGKECFMGIKLAADELQKENNQITLLLEDNYSDGDSCIRTIKTLFSKGCQIIVGPLASDNLMLVAPLIDTLNIPILAPTATAPPITQMSQRIFRVCCNDVYEGKALADFMYTIAGKKRVGMLVNQTSLYSKELALAFREKFHDLMGEIVGEEMYTTSNPTSYNFIPQIQRLIIMKNADAIFLPCYYNDALQIINQCIQGGVRCIFIGGDGWDVPELLETTKSYFSPCYFCTQFFKGDPIVTKFRNNYKKNTNTEPSSFSALGYDAIKLIGTLKIHGEKPENVIDALRSMDTFNGVTGKLSFKYTRDPEKDVAIVKIYKGKATLEQKLITKTK